MRNWSRNDVIALVTLVVTVITCIVGVIVPEVRKYFGLSVPAVASEPAPRTSPRAAAELAPTVPASHPAGGIASQDSPSTPAPQPDAGTVAASRVSWGAAGAPIPEDTPVAAEEPAPAPRQTYPDTPEGRQEYTAHKRVERAALYREQRAYSKGLVVFKVAPADTSVYVDRKFVGTPRELAAGIWIEAGDHAFALLRPGYQPREGTLSVVAGGSLDVEAQLSRADASPNPPAAPPAPKLDLPAGIDQEALAGIRIVIRYRGTVEETALAVQKRLSSYGLDVETEQDIATGSEAWNRLYYPACHEDAARAVRSLLSDLLRLTLMRSQADCKPTLDVVLSL
jgi:hypothetical protein